MSKKTIHAIIDGNVQGVFFREYTRREALKAGVTGWVRNKSDGTVETIISGSTESVVYMQNWLQQGSPHSTVLHVQITELEASETFSDFQIRL